MKQLILIIIFIFSSTYLHAQDDMYYPYIDKTTGNAGVFWMGFDLGSYAKIGTMSNVLPSLPAISPGVIIGFNFLDFIGLEAQGSFQEYRGTGKLFIDTGLIPNANGVETLTKIDVSLYLMFQPAFSLTENIKIIPYIGAGGIFSIIDYTYNLDFPKFKYATNINTLGASAKLGLRFNLAGMLIGAGVQYSFIQSDLGIDFSSLSYSLTLGFII